MDDLKVGDQMILNESSGQRVVRIARLTPTIVIIPGYHEGSERKFSRVSLRERGRDGWNIPNLEVSTPEIVQRVTERNQHRRLLNQVQGFPFHSLSTAQLEQIVEIVKND